VSGGFGGGTIDFFSVLFSTRRSFEKDAIERSNEETAAARPRDLVTQSNVHTRFVTVMAKCSRIRI